MKRKLLTLGVAALAVAVSTSLFAHDGMKFEPPDGKAFSGIGNDKQEADAFEAITEPFFRTSHEKLYIFWDTITGHPLNPTKLVNNLNDIASEGQIPHMGLDFKGFDPSFLPLDHAIALGKHDAYITKLAGAVKTFGKPIFILPGYEFNLVGYTPGIFPQAWRRIVDIFRDNEVENVVWCWNPFIDGSTAPTTFDSKTATGDWNWFPGDEYVDWQGVNSFQTHSYLPGATNPDALALQNAVNFAKAHNKPVVLSEITGQLLTSILPTSHPQASTQATQLYNQHYNLFLSFIENNDRMKGFIYISRDWTQFPQWATWGDHRVQQNFFLLQLFGLRLLNGKWYNGGQFSPSAYAPHQIEKVAIGNVVDVEIHNLPPGAPAALFVSPFKLAAGQKIGGVPYGKWWLGNPNVYLFTLTAKPNGKIEIPATIPLNPAYKGLTVYAQWVSKQGATAPVKVMIQ